MVATGLWPRAGTFWNAFDRPALKCNEQSILNDLLSYLEVVQETHKRPH